MCSIAHSSIYHHYSSTHAGLPVNLNLWAIYHLLKVPKAELHNFQLFFHIKNNSPPHLVSLSLLNSLYLSMVHNIPVSYPTMSPLSLWGHSPETAHGVLTPPVCSYVVCISVETVQTGTQVCWFLSTVLGAFSMRMFCRHLLLYVLMLGETPLQLCFVNCCVSFILTTQALGLPTPSTSSLLVEESFSHVFFLV